MAVLTPISSDQASAHAPTYTSFFFLTLWLQVVINTGELSIVDKYPIVQYRTFKLH